MSRGLAKKGLMACFNLKILCIFSEPFYTICCLCVFIYLNYTINLNIILKKYKKITYKNNFIFYGIMFNIFYII